MLNSSWTVVNQVPKFAITNIKRYVPVVNLSNQDNVKLLQQLKSGFKRTIKWNKYQSILTIHRQNQHLDNLTDPSFQGLNILFVLSFEDNAHRTSYKQYFPQTIEIKDYNVMNDGQNFFDQLVKNDLRTYDNIGKSDNGQGDYYTNGCLLDYPYFKEYYKLITIDLIKQQALGTDPKTIQQIKFTRNLG